MRPGGLGRQPTPSGHSTLLTRLRRCLDHPLQRRCCVSERLPGVQRVEEAFVALGPFENEMITELAAMKEGWSEEQHTFTGTPPHAPETERLPPFIDKHVIGQSHGLVGGVRVLERVDPLDVANANGDVRATRRRVAGKTTLQVEERKWSAVGKVREVRSADARDEHWTDVAEPRRSPTVGHLFQRKRNEARGGPGLHRAYRLRLRLQRRRGCSVRRPLCSGFARASRDGQHGYRGNERVPHHRADSTHGGAGQVREPVSTGRARSAA